MMRTPHVHSLPSTRCTWMTDQEARPCAVGMPASFKPSAMALRLVFPAACRSLMIGGVAGPALESARACSDSVASARPYWSRNLSAVLILPMCPLGLG